MRIGTRGSALALWQARSVAQQLERAGAPGCEIVVIRTSGDEAAGPPDALVVGTSDAPLTNIKRAFVKEIEDALYDRRVEIAVHSAKDLPAVIPDGLRVGGALTRADPRDALVLPADREPGEFETVKRALGDTPRLGTSSVRRAAALRRAWPNAHVIPIRGNVDTRLRKLDAGACDAIVLAAAGLRRLGQEARISALVPLEIMIPAPGQGIVAIEHADAAPPTVFDLVQAISDADAMAALLAERAIVHALGGDCQMPLGALATIDAQTLTLRASVASPDGRRVISSSLSGNRGNPAAVGEKLAAQLLKRGALDVLSLLPPK